MSKAAILIVEDDKNLGDTLNEYLIGLGHTCSLAKTAKEAKRLFTTAPHPKIILMDIGLPDGNGLELAKEFRANRKDFVLLFLSALNDPDIKVQGLEIGAQDYITKPFALKELTLRLNRILASEQMTANFPEEIVHGDLKIWFGRYEIQNAFGEVTSLSQKECAILKILYQYQNQAIDRNLIIENVWGEDAFPSSRTVDNYIVSLRKWCETDPRGALCIESIRGIGYKLKVAEVNPRSVYAPVQPTP